MAFVDPFDFSGVQGTAPPANKKRGFVDPFDFTSVEGTPEPSTARLGSFGFAEEESDRLAGRAGGYPADYFSTPAPETRAEMSASPDYGWLTEQPGSLGTGALKSGALSVAGGAASLVGRLAKGNVPSRAAAKAGIVGYDQNDNPIFGEPVSDVEYDAALEQLSSQGSDLLTAAQNVRAETPTQYQGEQAPTIPRLIEQGIRGGLESIPAMLGGPATMLAQVYGSEGGRIAQETYNQAMEAGASPEAASAQARAEVEKHALASSILQLPTEYIPAGRAIGRALGGATSAGANLAQTTVEEAIAEPLTGTISDIYDVAARGQAAPSVGEFIRNRAEEAVMGAAGGTAIGGGGQAIGGVGRALTGVPAFDAGLASVQGGEGASDVELPSVASQEAITPPTPTSSTVLDETPAQSVTEASTAIVEPEAPPVRYTPALAAQVVDNRLAALTEASQTGRLTPAQVKELSREEEDLVETLRENEARGDVGVTANPQARLTPDELSFITNRREEIRTAFEQNRAARAYSNELDKLQKRLDRTDNDNDFIAIAESIQPAFEPAVEEASVAPQATNVADSATQPTMQNTIPLAETAVVEATDGNADPLAFLDEAPSNIAAKVAARGEVATEMAEEGWTGSTAKRRAEMARRMTARGFPEEAAPDATARTERAAQQAPIQANESARVQRDNKWVDATVVETNGEDAVVQFNDGQTVVKPVQEVERMERVPTPTVGAAREILSQLREEGRVGDTARFNELMAARTGELDSLDLTPEETSAFERMFERSRQTNDDTELLRQTAEIGRRSARAVADEKGITPQVETFSARTGVPLTYASSIDDLDGLVRPEVLARTKGLDDQRIAAGSRAVRKGTYYRASDTLDGKPLVVIYPENANSPSEAAFTAAHEIAGHHGVRTLIAKGDVGKYDTLMKRLSANAVVQQVAKSISNKRKNTNMTLMTEEALADLSAAVRTGDFQRIKDRHGVEVPKAIQSDFRAFIDRVVNALKRLIGAGTEFSDGQVRELIENSWKAATESQTDSDSEVLESAEGNDIEDEPSRPDMSNAERALMTQRGPDSTWAKRRAATARLAKGLLSPYGLAGREVETIRQSELRGRIQEGLYLAGIPATRLAAESRKAGLKSGDVVRALRSGDLSKLPVQVRMLAEGLQTELQSLYLRAFEERLINRPADQKLTKSEMKAMMKTIDSAFQFPEVYRKDIDPTYSANIIRDFQRNKLSKADRAMVVNAMNDTMAQVLIPHDLSKRVDDGLLGKPELVDYHRKWVGTNIQGKSVEQLTAELNAARDLFIKEAGSEDAVAMWALNSLLGENVPGRLPTAMFMNSRYDLTQGDNIPASVRKLWGEVDDVVINVQHAWANAAAELGQYRMMNTIAEKWAATGKATKAPNGENTKVIQGKEFGGLDGMYVSPKRYDSVASVAEMYTQSLSVNDAILRGEKEFTNVLLNKASNATRWTSGFLKANAIIGNAANWYFNLAGSPETVVGSGNVPVISKVFGQKATGQGFKEGIQGILGTTLLGARKTTNPYTAELIRAGITESAQVGEISNLLRNAKVRKAVENSSNARALMTNMSQLIRSGALEATNVYSIMDLWGPSVTYFKNKEDIKGFWDRTGKEYTDADLEREAADMTKNSTVTMSYIPQLIRMSEGHGLSYVLPYLFAAHRALGYNTYLGGKQIMEGILANDKQYVATGLARTIGNTAMAASFFARMSPFYALGSLPFVAAGNALTYLLDSDDEEDKAVLESIRQDDRLKLANPAVLHKSEDGTYYIVDMNRVLVNEPGLLTAEVAAKSAMDFINGDATAAEAAGALGTQLTDQVFANASLVRLFKGIMNPAGQSAFRRESREAYDDMIGDNGAAQRAELVAETALPKNVTTLWNEAVKNAYGKPTPETLRTLKSLGFPIYEVNPVRDAGGDNYSMGSKRFQADYSAARQSLKDSVGLLVEIPNNELEAAYVAFARDNLEAFRQAAPTIAAAHAQGAEPDELDQRMKDNGLSIPKNTREALADGRFELPTISDSFFKGELRMIEDEALKYNNPEEKLEEWRAMYDARLERLSELRDIIQETIDEGSFN